MVIFANKVNFGSFLKGLCGQENYDRLQELNKKPSENSEGLYKKPDSAILKPPKSDGEALLPIISGSPNLYKQKGDLVQENPSYNQENFQNICLSSVLGGDL